MAFNNSLKTNLIVKSYDTSGKPSGDLNAFEFAILDKDTYTSLSALQVPGKEILFAVGSPNQGQRKSGLKIDRLRGELNSELSFKSQPLNVNAIKFQKFTKDTKTNEYYFGYNGTDTCKSLEFECGKTYQFDVYVKGRAVRNIFGREMREVFQVTAPCCTPCTDGDCSDTIECNVVIDELVRNFNDPNRWISRFYTAEKIVSCTESVTPPDTVDLVTYCLTVCDSGTELDLANVQKSINDNEANGNFTSVKVKERNAPYTTYEVTVTPLGESDGQGQPSNFEIDGTVLQNCNECPSGFTLVAGGFAYLIEVDQASSAEASLGTLNIALNGSSTLTSRSLTGWDKGTATYYVTSSAQLTPTTADAKIVKYLGVVESTCTQDTAITYVWEECGTCSATERFLTVTLGLGDCDASADVYTAWQEYLDAHPEIRVEIDLAPLGDCKLRATVAQYSTCVTDHCDTTAVGSWAILAPFMSQSWVETDATGDVCTTTDLPTGCSCGIKFIGRSFNDLNELLDAPIYDILGYTEKDPIELSVSLLEPDGTTQVCEDKQPTFWHSVYADYRTLHGRDVMKEILLERQYRVEPYWNLTNKDALLLQKREGFKYGVDVEAYYFAITVSGNTANDLNWSTSINRVREDVVLYIHEDDVVLFNSLRGFLAGAFPAAKVTDLTGV